MAYPPSHLPPDRSSYHHDLIPSSQCPTSINDSRKALLVEDDESLRGFLKTWLERKGYAVRLALDSKEALRLYDACSPFFIVLIDYCLPNTGVIVARSIRQVNPSQRIVIAAFDYREEDEVPLPEDLADIPLLTDNNQLPELLGKIRYWATRDDVHRAIEMLNRAELLKLERFAEYRVRGSGRTAKGRTGKDLLQDVLLRTLQGAEGLKGRHWNKGVDFFKYLVWAIMSTANNWKQQQPFNGDVYLSSELVIGHIEEEEEHVIDLVASGAIPVDEDLIAREKQECTLAILDKDSEAQQVLHSLLLGMKKNEILRRYAITEKQYQATLKRIRRKLLG